MAKKIFVTDDDPAILEVVSIILEDAGYEVETSTTGVSLMEEDGPVPDLFLLDIWMLGKDGRDICKYLKSKERTRHVPIVIVSANRDIQQIAIDAGADGFLSKPFEMDDLVSLIADYVKN